jgi:YD repeat-containing protein
MRERENTCCPIWAYADPTAVVAVVEPETNVPGGYVLLGAAPNPVRSELATVSYSLAARSQVALETYDAAGRLLERHDLGLREAGANRTVVPRAAAAGIVFYRLRITDPETSAERAMLSGKIAFVK